MRFLFAPGFDRGLKRFQSFQKIEIQRRIDAFMRAVESGALPAGLGLKRLRATVWEFRLGLRWRVLFDWRGDRITLLFLGNHNEAERFLKRYVG